MLLVLSFFVKDMMKSTQRPELKTLWISGTYAAQDSFLFTLPALPFYMVSASVVFTFDDHIKIHTVG